MVMGRAPGRLVIAFYSSADSYILKNSYGEDWGYKGYMYVKHSDRAKIKSGRRGAKFFFLLHLHLHFFFLLFFIFPLTSSPILPLKSIEFLAVGGLEPLARPLDLSLLKHDLRNRDSTCDILIARGAYPEIELAWQCKFVCFTFSCRM
jgi:hypothetical protein